MAQRQVAALIAGVLVLVCGGAALTQQPGDCGYYVNSAGHQVPRPCGDARNQEPPQGATAICRDGTFSYSEHPYARNTCSHHGGVQKHLR
jgi:hypothetical protein